MSVQAILADRITRNGPLPLSDVLEVALYNPGAGFYESGGAAGRRQGDFLTSPEVGALFGAVVARMLDGWWEQAGRPSPFLVVEAGAGPGTLARMVLAAQPECSEALRYVLVERAARQRAGHGKHLPLEDPALVLPPVDPDSGLAIPEAPPGPICASLADLPRVPGVPTVVLANELLDNLPFDLAQRQGGRWLEVRVGLDGGARDGPEPDDLGATQARAARRSHRDPHGPSTETRPLAGAEASSELFFREHGALGTGSFEAGVEASVGDSAHSLREMVVPLDERRVAMLERLVPDAPEGARVPLQDRAGDWLREALTTAGPGGRVVVFDYGAPTAELARRPQLSWMRTYRQHARGTGYLDDLGSQDVTCEVAIDQLAMVRPPEREVSQSAWLEERGIGQLVGEAEQVWTDRAHIGDLKALAARSRVNESRALLDPEGLGAFRVLEWPGG